MFKPPPYIISNVKHSTAQSRVHVSEKKLNIFRFTSATKKALFRTFRENFKQYISNTTLHGLKYVGDKTLSSVER